MYMKQAKHHRFDPKPNPFQNAPVITIEECKAVPFTLAQFVPGLEVGTLVCAVGTRDDGFPM